MSTMTKNAHAVDNSVAERRLRAIYDWLDSGNNKKALQECEKVLKKTPKMQCARALKALSLQRMNRNEEALTILDDLTLEDPTDEPTLQAMTLCCREMKRLDKVCSLYEKAAKLDPGNEEIQTQLFMSHVRIGNWKNQQNVAMSLYKHKPKNPYYCWAVMSIILQAKRGEGLNDQQKSFVLLSLAERMMNKLIYDNKLEAEQEVQLYVMILEYLGKFDEIIKLIDGNLGKKLTSSNIPQMKLKYFKLLNHWGQVNLICKEILLQNVDRWNIWLDYIESVLKLEKNDIQNNKNAENNENVETIDDNCEKAHEFICRIIENGHENNFLMRGPYLARLELYYQMALTDKNAAELLGDVAGLCMEYFRKFGYKPCCVSDLRKYLGLLSEEKSSELAERMVKDVGIEDTSVPQSMDQMQRHICALQLSRIVGAHSTLSDEHKCALLTALTLLYEHGRNNLGKNLLSTDLGPADAYALLAAHLLCDLAKNKNDSNYFVVALALLEGLLANSPSNFHAKLLALKINHIVGNTLGAQEMYNSLDVKHLQLDSLGYIHYLKMPTTGHFSSCPPLYDHAVMFFSANYKDSSDHLTFSYKYGSFLKLTEFMDFRQKLHDSYHYAQMENDRIFSQLIECQSTETLLKLNLKHRDDQTDVENLQDNYDFKVYAHWDPRTEQNESENRETFFETSKKYLKIRRNVVDNLQKAVTLTSVTLDDSQRQSLRLDLETSLDDWCKFESTMAVERSDWPTSRLEAGFKCNYYKILGNLIRLLINPEKTELLENIKCALCETNNLIKNDDFLPTRRKILEIIVNFTEIISISTLICGLLTSKTSSSHKKGKKKSATPPQHQETLKIITTATENLLKTLETVNLDCHVTEVATLCSKMKLCDGNAAQVDIVGRDIRESYEVALKEIAGILKQKLKFLQSCSS